MKEGTVPSPVRMAFKDYLAANGANFSTLKLFARTAAHARAAMLEPPDQTAAQALGQAIHCAVIEPSRLIVDYAVAPKCDKRTKEGKAIWAAFKEANPTAEPLTEEDGATIEGVSTAVWNHGFARELLEGAVGREEAVFFQLEVEGVGIVDCKARLDLRSVVGGWTFVADLKGEGDWITDGSPEGFSKEVARRHYHAQAAFYLDALNALAEHPRRFVWIVVEKERPHLVACYEPDDQMIEQGRRLYRSWLYQYAHCKATGEYPGYDPGCQYLALPRWAVQEI